MHKVTIHEAKTHLSRLIQEALAGEEVIIAKGNEPLVKLTVLPSARPGRKVGSAPDLVEYMADDFNSPLDDMAEYMG